MKQMQTTNNLAMKKKGFWTMHYTMTLWNNEDDIKQFARTGAHLEAMKKSKSIAKEIRILTMDADSLPDWQTGINLLLEKGKVISY